MKNILYEMGKTFYALSITSSACTMFYQLYINIQINGFTFANYGFYNHWSMNLFEVGCFALMLGSICLLLLSLVNLVEYLHKQKTDRLVNAISDKVIEKLKAKSDTSKTSKEENSSNEDDVDDDLI